MSRWHVNAVLGIIHVYHDSSPTWGNNLQLSHRQIAIRGFVPIVPGGIDRTEIAIAGKARKPAIPKPISVAARIVPGAHVSVPVVSVISVMMNGVVISWFGLNGG
jgi:hypothetical protein